MQEELGSLEFRLWHDFWSIPLLDGAFFVNQHLILQRLLEINVKRMLKEWKDK